jgi:hypothetical protein
MGPFLMPYWGATPAASGAERAQSRNSKGETV